MKRQYKITYKTYFNDRLKKVKLHTTWMYPLYVQVTYERKTIFFKSYFFEFYAQPRLLVTAIARKEGEKPLIQEIIEQEEKLLAFIIERHQTDFSLELLKKEYAYYSKDLCDATAKGFIDSLALFFENEGIFMLGDIIRNGIQDNPPYMLISAFKNALKEPVFDRLMTYITHEAPPYYILHQFTEYLYYTTLGRTNLLSKLYFSAIHWKEDSTLEKFKTFIDKEYPKEDADYMTNKINSLLLNMRSKL